jgi:hypothetical protein
MLQTRFTSFTHLGRFMLAAVVPIMLPVIAVAAPGLSAKQSIAPLVSVQTVIASQIPQAAPGLAKSSSHVIPFRSGHTPAVWASLKAAAVHNAAAPAGFALPGLLPSTSTFKGMSDSTTICPYFGGCQPPDGAIAASKSYVVEGVNTSFAVYQTNGALVSGWPKNSTKFFGIPNPGACDPSGAFTSDPRAYYDAVNGRFWLALLQVQGPAIGDSCAKLSKYWLAVSDTSNPNGAWHVYAFNMDPGNTGNFADFTEIGFNNAAACFSGNMFSQTSGTFQYSEAYCANRATMNAGGAVTAYGFSGFNQGGTPLDTIQPVDTLASSVGDPGVEFFVQTFNINFGGGSCSSACNGGVVWAMTAPGTSSEGITGLAFSTNSSYSLPPQANEPGCGGCLDTDDVRISGTPVYRAGGIFFALTSAVNNGKQIVPGFVWQQLNPTLNSSGGLTAASAYQGATYYLTGQGNDQAAFYPAVVTDSSNNMAMVLDTSSGGLYASTAYLYRRVLDPLGQMSSYSIFHSGSATSSDSRWGDYNAASWDGSDTLWIEGEYAPGNDDWATYIKNLIF